MDIIVQLPAGGGAFPILAQREGDTQRTGIILASHDASVSKIASQAPTAAAPVDLSLEQSLEALSPLGPRRADVVHRIELTGNMIPHAWSIDNHTRAHRRALRVTSGQRVVVEMINRSPMAHPMHLHGHHLQVIGLNG